MRDTDLSKRLGHSNPQSSERQWYRLSLIFVILTVIAITLIDLGTRMHLKALKREKRNFSDVQTQLENVQREYDRREVQKKGYDNQPTTMMIADMLSCVARIIPDDVRLESVSFEAHQHTTFHGIARSIKALGQFMNALQHEGCLKNSTLHSLSRVSHGDKFAFTVVIKPTA